MSSEVDLIFKKKKFVKIDKLLRKEMAQLIKY